MRDLIDRQAAIDAVRSIVDDTPDSELSLEDVAFRDGVQYAISILSNLPSVQPEDDTIEMQEADIDETMKRLRDARVTILPSAEPEIIYCKDCRKHNVKVGFDENFHIVWKEDACPLVDWRGKAQGHEFDYQHCSYGERREDE